MKYKMLLAAGAALVASATAQAQLWSDLTPTSPLPGGTGGTAPNAPLGTVQLFTDEMSFLAAAPTVLTETFENNLQPDNTVATCTEPVNSMSNDICYAPGNLLDGFSVTSSSGGGVVILTTGFLGAPSDIMGANNFVDTTIIAFNPPVSAVGMQLFTNAQSDIQISYLDAGSNPIDTGVAPMVPALPGSAYLGAVSPTPIGSIVIEAIGDNGELVDNLSFGNLGPPPIVPTLNIAGLAALGLGLIALAAFVMRRRSRS